MTFGGSSLTYYGVSVFPPTSRSNDSGIDSDPIQLPRFVDADIALAHVVGDILDGPLKR